MAHISPSGAVPFLLLALAFGLGCPCAVDAQVFQTAASGSIPLVNASPQAIDIDGSGSPDLVFWDVSGIVYVPDPGAGGPGTFTWSTPIPLFLYSSLPTWTVLGCSEIADVNGDTFPDLIKVAALGGTTTVFLIPGAPGGVLGAPVQVATFTGVPSIIRLADVDGDGMLDLVVSHSPNPFGIFLGSVDFWLNRPGTWTLARTEPAQMWSAIQADDFDQDGDDDVVFADGTGRLVFVTGQPTGVLAPSTSLGLPAATWGTVGTADMDSDGFPDLVGTSAPVGCVYCGINMGFFLIRGNPNLVLSGFTALTPPSPQGLINPDQFTLADVDADGRTDMWHAWLPMAVGAGAPVRTNFMQRGDGAGTLTASTIISTRPWNGPPEVLADFDGDGDLDIFATGYSNWSATGTNMPFVFQENLALYGQPCAGTGGAPQFGLGAAFGGHPTFSLSLSGAAPNAPCGLFASLAQSGTTACGPLIDLTPASLLLPLGGIGLFTTSATGSVTWTFPLPAVPAALPPVYVQWAVQDPAGAFSAGGASYATTRARAVTIF